MKSHIEIKTEITNDCLHCALIQSIPKMEVGWIPFKITTRRRLLLFGKKTYTIHFLTNEMLNYDKVIKSYVDSEQYEEANMLKYEKEEFMEVYNNLISK